MMTNQFACNGPIYVGLDSVVLPLDPGVRFFMAPEEVFVLLLEQHAVGSYLARIAEQPDALGSNAQELELTAAQVALLMVYEPDTPSYRIKEQLLQAQSMQPDSAGLSAPAHNECPQPHASRELDQVEHFRRESVIVPLLQISEADSSKTPASLSRYVLCLVLDYLGQVCQSEANLRERKVLKARVRRIRGLFRFGLQGVLHRLLDIIPIYSRGGKRDDIIALRVDIDIPALA